MSTQDDNLTPKPEDVEPPKDPTPSVDYLEQFKTLNSRLDELEKQNDELKQKLIDMEDKKDNGKAIIKHKTYY